MRQNWTHVRERPPSRTCAGGCLSPVGGRLRVGKGLDADRRTRALPSGGWPRRSGARRCQSRPYLRACTVALSREPVIPLYQGQPLPPSKVRYELFELRVSLEAVVRFPDLDSLASIGFDVGSFGRTETPSSPIRRYISGGHLARPERFELPTTWFVARYSIQLSYGRVRERDYRGSRAPERARRAARRHAAGDSVRWGSPAPRRVTDRPPVSRSPRPGSPAREIARSRRRRAWWACRRRAP